MSQWYVPNISQAYNWETHAEDIESCCIRSSDGVLFLVFQSKKEVWRKFVPFVLSHRNKPMKAAAEEQAKVVRRLSDGGV